MSVNWESVLAESAKMAAQLGGALIIARLTVTWALSRYKGEKMWERRTTALADVLSAMREMSRVVDRWLAEENEGLKYSETHKEDLRERYRMSRRKLENVAAIAILIMPGPIADSLKVLEDGLNAQRFDWLDRLEAEQKLLSNATTLLLTAAKEMA